MHILQRAGITTLALVGLASAAAAQTAPLPTPFNVIGYIQAMTLNDPADALSGGTITANGITVTVPRNAIVTMPAAFLSMRDLFATAPAPYGLAGNGQSGLALGDTPPPLSSYEVDILGNVVGGVYVAGLVHISGELANVGQGAVNCIDYALGELRVGGVAGNCATGTRVRFDDPTGRHGRPASHDPRVSCDPENQNIRSITGYPMCLPRADPAVAADPLCPQSNRPKDLAGAFVTRWVMGISAALGDATQQAPFEVGDQVIFSSTLAQDGQGTFNEAWTVVANLGISTRPGVDPAYVAIDEMVFGTGGAPVTDPAGAVILQDAVLQMTIAGFTTDPTRLVDAFAVDVDPATGAESQRLVTSMNPAGLLVANAFATDVLNAAYLPLFREVRARIRGATSTAVANGFTSGTYRAPVDGYVFPVNLRAGDPLVPLNLQDLPFLACSSGLYSPSSGGPGVLAGQLAPFPYSPTPDPLGCHPPSPQGPIASAGADFALAAGATGTLDASASFDPSGGSLTYNWIQTSGPAVLLSNPNFASPTFDAPAPSPGDPALTLGFDLLVTNAFGSARDAVIVTVAPGTSTAPGTPADPGSPSAPATTGSRSSGGGCGTAPGSTTPAAALALVAALLHGRARRWRRGSQRDSQGCTRRETHQARG